VHDDVVLFVQNEDALYSYTLGGTFVWFADSLGFGTTSGVVGAPVLLVDPTLVVPCRSSVAGEREVCAVRQSNGELSWRSPVGGGAAQGLAVGENGTIFVTRTLAGGGSELVALWSRVLPDIDGWPAEGGGQQHSRRR
jgi:outer membrane protein assembly factor BamB